jgi:hypothetical protein
MRSWKRYWGDLLAVQVRQAMRDRRFGEAFRGVGKLLRYRPGALLRRVGSDRAAA